jgi:ABC-2 type transport system permease protein
LANNWKKFWRIFWRYARMNMMKTMAYRADALVRVFTSLFWYASQLGLIYFIYRVSGVQTIAGFRQTDMYLVFAFLQLTLAVVYTVIPGGAVYNISHKIYEGMLDIDLLLPFSTYWVMMLDTLNFRAGATSLTFAAVALPYFYHLGGFSFSVLDWLATVFIYVYAVVAVYLMYAIAISLNFYIEHFQLAYEFIDNMLVMSRFPRAVMPRAVQSFFVYLLPFFLVINPLYQVIAGTFGWATVELMLGILVVEVLVFSVLWRGGMQRYSSAA